MKELDYKIQSILNASYSSIFKLLEEERCINAPIEFAQVGRVLHTIVEKCLYNKILLFLDKVSLPQNYELNVEKYKVLPNAISGVSKLYIKLPNGEIDYNIFKYLIVDDSCMGAWQALLLHELWHILPLYDHSNYSSYTNIFNDSEKDLIFKYINSEDERLDGIKKVVESYDLSIKCVSFKDYYFILFTTWSVSVGLERYFYEIQIKDKQIVNINMRRCESLFKYNNGIRR